MEQGFQKFHFVKRKSRHFLRKLFTILHTYPVAVTVQPEMVGKPEMEAKPEVSVLK